MSFKNLAENANEAFLERYELVIDRVKEISARAEIGSPYGAYFEKTAGLICLLAEIAEKSISGACDNMSEPEGKVLNRKVYEEVSKDNYGTSFANPAYAVSVLGKDYGQLLSALVHLIRSSAVYAFEGEIVRLCLYAELFVEIYVAMQDEDTDYETVKEIYRSFMHDSQEITRENAIARQFDPAYDFTTEIVREADLSNPAYLYRYGLFVSNNEIEISAFLNTLSQEEIQSMADTYTEGYRIGFQTCNKELSKKGIAQIRYPIGFERMVRAAIENFEKMGLKVVCTPSSTSVNKQYDFDFRESQALFFDKAYVERALEVVRASFDNIKDIAPLMAGPAVIEVFGEEPFSPEFKEEALTLDEKQQQLDVYFTNEYMQIYSAAIDMENRSFTIIAYPIPEIGNKFQEIFAETVKINTLDYSLYQGIQQKIIDVLDTADYVHILGTNGNKTDLKVKIYPLSDRQTETAFENCVADVNIPVGEVFTSPVLEGTEGKLHVSQVYLNELNYLNLELDFKDGKIAEYTCTNFEKEEENRKYIEDNLLFHHETLPMGEFAIGTNTTAYVMARKYDIAAKMPILIAEKTGPHFAVGDTCYTYDEDNITYNPDGKKIVARDNSVSILRKEDPMKAYFNCHTDITIPYDELGRITAVAADGTRTDIIVDGRFVVPGTEELNKALDNM